MSTFVKLCGKCGATEGKLHELGCGLERCRQCGDQFISCECATRYFYPNDLPDDVFYNGLTEEQENEWLAHIETLGGRVPYIDWPLFCARCGKFWPDFFRVSDEEWARYIEIEHRHEIVCIECYEVIKSLIDGEASGVKVVDIKTRKPPVTSEEVKAAALHLIRICDVRETVALLSVLLYDGEGIPLLSGAPDTREVRQAISEILDEAVSDLDFLTDRFALK